MIAIHAKAVAFYSKSAYPIMVMRARTHNSSKTVFIAKEDNRATLIKSESIGMVLEAMRKHTEDTFVCLYGCITLTLFGLEEGKQRRKQR